jgi:hypothetical protein
VLEELVEFGGAQEGAAIGVVEERPDAEVVTGAEERAVARIPDDVSEITDEAAGRVLAPAFEGPESQLGVGASAERGAEGSLDLIAIVNPSVEDRAKPADIITKGLPEVKRVGGGGEQGETETYGPVSMVTDAVRPAVGNGGDHAFAEHRIDRPTVEIVDYGKPTHWEKIGSKEGSAQPSKVRRRDSTRSPERWNPS